jgi:hypothetical protein
MGMSAKQPPKQKRHHSRSMRYVPSDEARRFVLAMARLHMTQDSIRRVIDPNMSKTTFHKAFKGELENGSACMHGLIANKLKEAMRPEAVGRFNAPCAICRNLGGTDTTRVCHSFRTTMTRQK